MLNLRGVKPGRTLAPDSGGPGWPEFVRPDAGDHAAKLKRYARQNIRLSRLPQRYRIARRQPAQHGFDITATRSMLF